MSEDKETIYVIRGDEPVFVSWMRDSVSFGGLMLTAWFLNTQMRPSGWINFALAIAWILWLLGRGARQRMNKTPAEIRQWLDEKYPERMS